MYESRLVHVAHRRAKTSPALPNIVGSRLPVLGHIAMLAFVIGLVPSVAVRAAGWGTWAYWFVGAGCVSAVIGRALTRGSTLHTQLLEQQNPSAAAIFGVQAITLYRRSTSYYSKIVIIGCALSLAVNAGMIWIDRPFVLTSSFIRHRLEHGLTVAAVVIGLALVAEALASCSAWFNLVDGRLQVLRNAVAFILLPALAVTFVAGWSGRVIGSYRSVFASLGEIVVSGARISGGALTLWIAICLMALIAQRAIGAGAVRVAAGH